MQPTVLSCKAVLRAELRVLPEYVSERYVTLA